MSSLGVERMQTRCREMEWETGDGHGHGGGGETGTEFLNLESSLVAGWIRSGVGFWKNNQCHTYQHLDRLGFSNGHATTVYCTK
jgi:hypothetical protein